MKGLKIMSIIFAVIAILGGALTLIRDNSMASKLADATKDVDPAMQGLAEKLMKEMDVPTSGELYACLGISVVLSIVLLIGVILVIQKNSKVGIIAIAAVLIAIVSIIMHPEVEMGSTGGVSPRTASFFQAIPAIISGICMFLFGNKLKSAH